MGKTWVTKLIFKNCLHLSAWTRILVRPLSDLGMWYLVRKTFEEIPSSSLQTKSWTVVFHCLICSIDRLAIVLDGNFIPNERKFIFKKYCKGVGVFFFKIILSQKISCNYFSSSSSWLGLHYYCCSLFTYLSLFVSTYLLIITNESNIESGYPLAVRFSQENQCLSDLPALLGA